jgi:hypothetical protein
MRIWNLVYGKRSRAGIIICLVIVSWLLGISLIGCGRSGGGTVETTTTTSGGATTTGSGGTTTTTGGGATSTTTTPLTTTTTLGPPWDSATGSAAFAPREGHAVVAFNAGGGEKMWLIGGFNSNTGKYYNDVWYSSDDGATWNMATAKAAFASRESFACVVANLGSGDRIWVIGGADQSKEYNDVWSSDDGVTWTNVTTNAAFSARDGSAAVFYNSKIWIIAGANSPGGGGLQKDVWHSNNGITWEAATNSAGFLGRFRHSAAVFNSKMWIIGGWTGAGDAKDVWSSSDGATWDQAASAPFSGREGHTSVSTNSNGKLWVIGGAFATDFKDIWYTTDGDNWSMQTNNAFPARNHHASVLYGGKIWTIGGRSNNTNTYYNDVWNHTP